MGKMSPSYTTTLTSQSWYSFPSDVIYATSANSRYTLKDNKKVLKWRTWSLLCTGRLAPRQAPGPQTAKQGVTAIADASYQLSDPTLVLEADPYYTDCALFGQDITYAFTANGAAISNPPFSAAGPALSVSTSAAGDTGVYTMVLEAKVGTAGNEVTNNDATFSLDISGCCLVEPASGNILADQTYTIQTEG